MSIRSGPWIEIRAAATYADINTWYQVDTDLTMGPAANCLRLYVSATVAAPGALCFYVQHSPDGGTTWYDYCKPSEPCKLWGSLLYDAVGTKSIELDGLNLPPGEQVRVFFHATSAANSCVLGIKALVFESGIKPLNGPGPDFYTRVAQGLDPRYSSVYKFGDNPDIDTASTPEDVWNFGGAYTYSTTADIDTLSSSSAADTGQTIVVIGQTADYTEVTQAIVTNGQSKVTLTTPLWRVYRLFNVSGAALAGTLYCYVDGATTGGVPNVASTVRAIIDDGDNQTMMALYTVPRYYTGWLVQAALSFSREAISTVSLVYSFAIRNPGGVFRVQNRGELSNGGTSARDFRPATPLGPLPSGTDIRLRVESVTANDVGAAGNFIVLLQREKS